MLNNPILGTMSVEDLTQRYSGSYVVYESKPYYVEAFRKSTVKGIRVEFEVMSEHNLQHQLPPEWRPFVWDRLDIGRPRTGWYLLNGDLNFVYRLSARQYCRGIGIQNYGMKPMTRQGNSALKYYDLLKQYVKGEEKIPKKTSQEIKDIYKQRKEVMLSNQVAIARGEVYVNLTPCGIYLDGTGEFILDTPHFIQEIKDAVIDPVFKEPVQKEPVKKEAVKNVFAQDALDEFLANMQDIGPPNAIERARRELAEMIVNQRIEEARRQ